jgi:hypothetical protein
MCIDRSYYGAICSNQTEFSSPIGGGRGGQTICSSEVHTCKYFFFFKDYQWKQQQLLRLMVYSITYLRPNSTNKNEYET